MKLSISLPSEDVVFIDSFLEASSDESRSAVVQRGIAMLRAAELADAYAEAFEEWQASGATDAWDVTAGDAIR
jgi:Arc/MetJ-type ribon-helix-helix transcriptional regulator